MLVHANLASDGLAAMIALIDAGSKLLVYSGAVPAALADPIGSAQLLLSYDVNAVPFGAITDEGAYVQAVANPILESSAIADGVPTFFRITDSGDVVRLQGSVSESGSGGEVEISTANVLSGMKVSVSGLSARLGKGT